MEKMSRAMEKVKILVGMEVEEDEAGSSSSFLDDFNRECTLSTQQVFFLLSPSPQISESLVLENFGSERLPYIISVKSIVLMRH